jgi:hypothetical protein
MSDTQQKDIYKNMMNIFNSLSFYAPLILLSSVFMFSMFTGTISKFGWFLLWGFVITCLRLMVYKPMDIGKPSVCNTFIPYDYTYSTYILSFTMMYFIFPMIMVTKQSSVNSMNYGVLAVFIGYIALDLFIKHSLTCIDSYFSQLVIINFLSGIFFGILISLGMYSTSLKGKLYINEINSNREVCSMPSKQQFKCSLYKNGELVSSSVN